MQWATHLHCGPRKGLFVGDRQHRRRPVLTLRALDGRAQQAFGSGSSGPFKGLSLQQQQQLAQQGQQAQQQQQVAEGREEDDQQQRAAAAASPGDAQRAASPPPSGIAGHGDLLAEWTAWTAFFEEMDSNGNALDQVTLQLQRAIAEERYADAARLQGRAAALAAGDAAASLRKRMGEALEAEDYATAVALRDEGYAWLEGWWWGKAQDGDSVGHLMRVTAEYGRWTGRIYSARDIAESLGWFAGAPAPPGPGAAGRWRAGGAGGAGSASAGGRLDAAALEDAGAPLLEVFLRDGASAAAAPRGPQQPPASLRAQPVCLWPGAAGGGSGSGAAAAATGAPGDARALLSVLGTSAAPPAPARQPLGSSLLEDIVGSSLVVEEDEQILQALRDLDLGGLIDAAGPDGASAAAAGRRTGTDASPGKGGAGEGDAAAAAAVLTVSVDEDGVATITAEDLSSAAEAAAAAAAVEQQRLEEEQQQQQNAAAAAAGDSGTVQLSRFDSQWELDEVEATLRELRGESAAAPPAAPTPSSPSAGAPLPPPPPPVRTRPQPQGASSSPQLAPPAAAAAAVTATPESWELQRHPADLIPLGRDRFVLVPREAPAAATPSGASSPSAAAAEALAIGRPPSPSPYDPRNAAAAAASAAASSSSPFSALFSSTDEEEDNNLTEDQLWARVAEEVARIQEARSGIAVPRAELAEAIRTVARRLVREGRLPADAVPRVRIVAEPPSPASAARAAAAAAAAAAAPPAAPPAVTYTRLQGHGVGSGGNASAGAAADPLSGLYLGSFGAHGPELLQLQRGVDEDGDECVVATKVTGDDNVPCGQISFRAKVGRRHRLDTRSLYPEEMRVTARYAGQGRVADADFSDAQWVDGELLLFGGPPNPVTGGARVGFVWSVPDDRRFLILLTRVQLE